ncbi:MAG TPA: SDR family oxidoreductase [Bryobacterales bacterium]|nr:SDR family oxidoreductase [Bryobacterales bacterium]
MSEPLSGQVALVTGGTRGIGRSIAERLLEAKASVVICGRQLGNVSQAVREMAVRPGGRIEGKACDVARYEDVAELFRFVRDKFGRLDVLVNNAGVGVFKPVDQISSEQWREVVETNLSGAFYCTREAAPLMKQHGGGYIINIGSLAGKNPMNGGAAYNASKFGLVGLSEASMLDLRYENIRVSYIMPGSVATAFAGAAESGDGWKISPRDIAETVVHLLQSPARTLVSRVEMRPTKPPRR